jgi:phosphocarrier protein FPr
MQERANDAVDVGQRVLRSLTGTTLNTLDLTEPSIIVATDLTPSDTARLDRTKVVGICTTLGSATSHSAILARSLGIPAVVGVSSKILNLTNSTSSAIDGSNGQVWIQPDANTLAALHAQQNRAIATQQQAQVRAKDPAITRDARRVSILANINGIADARLALEQGAEGVGLLRTEFLYLDRKTAPTEDEQLEIYQAIAQILDNRPLIIRTLDIGGDKPLSYLGLQPEANPFLGWRGIRFCLDRPDIFKSQLRAILKASPGSQIKVMFPAIATLAEVQAAKAILAQVQTEFRQAGIPFDETMEVGIMIEIPSAVAIADRLAAEVDFFSIGTNDLSQYVMAADRTNPKVAPLADALHPAVLRMIHQTVQAARQAGIWVSICGELAAEPLATPILLGLGLDELSLAPQAIPALKQRIAQLTLAEAEAIAASALQLDSATQVRTLVSQLSSLQEG